MKKLLAQYATEFEVVDVDRLDSDQRKQTLEEVKHYIERLSFPTTVIGDEIIVGYKADRIKKALGNR